VNKLIILIFILLIACSKNEKNNKSKVSKLYDDKKIIEKELNKDLKLTLSTKIIINSIEELKNNISRNHYNGTIESYSKFKFKKISTFYQNEPELIFEGKNTIFFNGKGAIIKFDDNSNVLWKKNHYSKAEKKSKPFLFLAKSKNILLITDNIANYYALDILNGNLLWSKKNSSPFNSEIKVYRDKFYAVDLENTIHCFSIKSGEAIWKYKTDNFFIKAQKKLSIVINDNILYFNNSIGDITAINTEKGGLVWQYPTQNNQIYGDSFLLKNSDLVINQNSIFFSNNKNEFYSLNKTNGILNWKQQINSYLRPIFIENIFITITNEGLFVVGEIESGNIIRTNNIFKDLKRKKNEIIKPVQFVSAANTIYLTLNNGKLIVIDINSGNVLKIIKIDNKHVSKPIIKNKKLFIIKDDSIIRFD
jgi:outer membrane protein assembly factor BamB